MCFLDGRSDRIQPRQRSSFVSSCTLILSKTGKMPNLHHIFLVALDCWVHDCSFKKKFYILWENQTYLYMIVGSIYLIFKLAKIGKKLGSLCQNTRKEPKNTKKTAKHCKEMVKISVKSPNLYTNQSNQPNPVLNSRQYA